MPRWKQHFANLRRLDLGWWLLFGAACGVILCALHVQRKYWVDLPIWDEWDTPGAVLVRVAQHQLGWNDLIAQHNESRKLFPRLLYIVVVQLFGWDVRHGMLLTFLSSCGISAFALHHLKRPDRDLGRPAVFAWLLVNAALFVPSQYENFLCGNQFEILVPVLALFTAIAINLSSWRLWVKAGGNALLALLATYSFAHGMLLWAFAIPLPNELPKPVSWSRWIRQHSLPYLIYSASAAAAVSYYFDGYEHPSTSPRMAGFSDLPRLVDFFIVWLGAPWRSTAVSAHPAGALIAVVLVIATVLSGIFLARNRQAWRLYYPWLLLAAFACASGMVTALGRVNIGTEMVFASGFDGISAYRYYLTSVLADAAVVGLLYRLWRDCIRLKAVWNARFVVAVAVAVTLLAVAWRNALDAEWTRLPRFYENRARAKAAVMWSAALPENPDLFLAYPYIKTLPGRIAEMTQLGLLKLPAIPGEVARAIQQAPTGETAGVGVFDATKIEPGGRLRVRGWARNPTRNTRAECVVLGWLGEDASFHPFTTILLGNRREDLVQAFKSPMMRRAGFDQEIAITALPQRELKLRGWSVDLKNGEVFPFPGEISLPEQRIQQSQ